MSSPLRILHVVPYYEQAWAYGGIPRLAAAMARGLARRGHTVTVCTTDVCDATTRAPHVAPAGKREPTVHIFRNLSNSLAYHWQFFTPVGLAAHLRSQAYQIDIAHLHACRNLPGVIAARTLRRADVPYVISPNGTAPALERRILAKRVFDRTLGRGTLERAARVVAASDAERSQLVALGIPPAQIAVVPNPFDESEFASSPDPVRFRRQHQLGTDPIVLFLGKLTPRKGVDVLLHAFRGIANVAAQLVIAGNDMGSGRKLSALIQNLGLRDRVRMIGLLRGPDRLDALAAAHVVVYPSRDEIFGLVAVEALLCGTPVVVSGDSGCGEIVRGIGGGQIVPYGDRVALAAAIVSILTDRDRWAERAREAAGRVRDRFAAVVVSERLERLYGDVLQEWRASPERARGVA
jgi:glycosyltransferase involved in cell wall biosynthesis